MKLKVLAKLAITAAKYVFLGVCVVVIVFNLYSAVARRALGKQMPTLFGVSYAVVATGSMEPSIKGGEFILVRAQSAYEVGDVCSYTGAGIPTTHRITEVQKNAAGEITHYVTAGDANQKADGTLVSDGKIAADRFVGKVVFHNLFIGSFINYIQSPFGIISIIILGAAVYLYPKITKRTSTSGGAAE